MKKKRRKARRAPKAKISVPRMCLVSYNISDEPLPREKYPAEIDSQMAELYNLTYDNPKKAIPRLLELKTRYPQIPELYNWLAASQVKTGDFSAADITIKENYEKNPDYLFAKLNYAELCLRHERIEEIPVIFNNKLELSWLYPERDTFHISEVVGFSGIMAMYYYDKGEKEVAVKYYEFLLKIAPDHESIGRIKRRIGLGPVSLLGRLRKKVEIFVKKTKEGEK